MVAGGGDWVACLWGKGRFVVTGGFKSVRNITVIHMFVENIVRYTIHFFSFETLDGGCKKLKSYLNDVVELGAGHGSP